MIEPSASWPKSQTAPPPPIKRANPDRIPVSIHDGALIAHVNEEVAARLMAAGVAETFRSGPRRYLRLPRGISIPHTGRGWDIIELLRGWHGDKRAANYIANRDRESERLTYLPPSRTTGRRSAPRPTK